MSPEYGFGFPDGVPCGSVEPGSNVVVAGPRGSGACDVAVALTAPRSRAETALLVSADSEAGELYNRYEALSLDVDPSKVAAVDCPEDGSARRFDSVHDGVDGPADLRGITVELSALFERLMRQKPSGVRFGVFSVSELLEHSEHRDVVRFVHTLTGRVLATSDLGVLYVDSLRHEPEVVDALAEFCGVRVDVRERGGASEMRVESMDRATEWSEIPLVSGYREREVSQL